MLIKQLFQKFAARNMICGTIYGTVLYAAPSTVLHAQGASGIPRDSSRGFPSEISTSASAEVKVTPDRATIRVSVQTKARTAAVAATDNATKQTSVLSALRTKGISNEQLSTADYSVEPQYRYVQDKEPTLTGYVVTNTIVVDIRDIKQLGTIIDTALESGANMISSLEFYASNTSAARRQAIGEAVTKARADAEAAAYAGGGKLGGMLDLNVGSEIPSPPRPMYDKLMASNQAIAAQTPINPGQQTLIVSVFTRWIFIPSR